uniref:Uncharacterized protein n=1 Tax=Helianthus annuus TaxID=4232 RepID=A0A251V3A0_HELAN
MVEVVAETWWRRWWRWWRRRGGGDVVVEVVAEMVAEMCGGGGDAGLWAGEEVRRLKAMSAWGRGEADVFGLQIFRKTNKLQTLNICAKKKDKIEQSNEH